MGGGVVRIRGLWGAKRTRLVIGYAASPGRERGGTMTDSKYFTTTKKGEGGLLCGPGVAQSWGGGGGQGEVLRHTGVGVGRCCVRPGVGLSDPCGSHPTGGCSSEFVALQACSLITCFLLLALIFWFCGSKGQLLIPSKFNPLDLLQKGLSCCC